MGDVHLLCTDMLTHRVHFSIYFFAKLFHFLSEILNFFAKGCAISPHIGEHFENQFICNFISHTFIITQLQNRIKRILGDMTTSLRAWPYAMRGIL